MLGRQDDKEYSRGFGLIAIQKVKEFATRLIQRFDVRARSISVTAATLSGGNQQKLILARELEDDPQLLIAAQPTRGLDVGAIEFVWKQILEQKGDGRAVLLISAELDEIYELSDRIVTMYEGQITGEYSPDASPEETRHRDDRRQGESGGQLMSNAAPAPAAATRAPRRDLVSSAIARTIGLLLAFLLAGLLGSIIILAYGENPLEVYRIVFEFSFNRPQDVAQRSRERDAADLLRSCRRRRVQSRPLQHRGGRPVHRRDGRRSGRGSGTVVPSRIPAHPRGADSGDAHRHGVGVGARDPEGEDGRT